MTETMTATEPPQVYGVYLDNEPVNVVRSSDHTRIVAQKDDRIVALQNLNEGKVQTIQDLREEVEATKRQAVELANGRDMYKRMYEQVREDIVAWADEYEMERETVNGLLETIGFDPLPEYVEAEIEVREVGFY